jgi:Protein of unknown function (DUF3618)
MATHAEARSLSEFEREAEDTRADLIHTVDELHHRVSPEAIKEQVKTYARDSGQDFIRNLERRARENPLQTVAVAAGLAYPAWRLLMHIPAPVLLVGAGLALAGKGGMPFASSYPMAGTESFADTAQRRMQDASAAASETLSEMKEKAAGAAGDAKAAVMSGMSAVSERAASMANDAMSSARDAMASAQDGVNSARNVASDKLSTAQETLSGTYQSAADAVARAPAQLTETWRQSSNTFAETIEAQPLVWGAVGLLAGAVIAFALPVTQAENQLFGETNEQLKKRASEFANQGMQVATEAAQDIYQDAAGRVKEQGIDPDVVRDTIKHAGEKVSSVVEQASNALKEDKAPSGPQSTSNIKPNIGD